MGCFCGILRATPIEAFWLAPLDMGSASLLTSDSSLCLWSSRVTPPLPESQLSSGHLLGQDSNTAPCSFAPMSPMSGQWETQALASKHGWNCSLFPVKTCLPLLCQRAGGSSPHLLPSVFSAQNQWLSLCPQMPQDFCFSLEWSCWSPVAWLEQRRKSSSIPSLLAGGKTIQHTLSMLLEGITPPPLTPQPFDILKVDNELTKSALEHLLCKPSTCGLASHFEIW